MDHSFGKKTPASKQLSSSLKERLKRCGRYHSSPGGFPPAKKPCWPADSPDPVKSDVHKVGQTCDENSEKPCAINDIDSGIFSPNGSNTLVRNKKDDFSTPILKSRQFKKLETPSQTSTSCQPGHSYSRSKPNRLQFLDQETSTSFTNKEKVEDNISKLQSESIFSRNEEVVSGQTNNTGLKDMHTDMAATINTESSAHVLQNEDIKNNLIKERNKLQTLLETKEEELRKLNMVKMYRTKNDLDQLRPLTNKWRGVTQQALVDLQEKMPEPKPTLTELINHLQIDHGLIMFDSKEETFN